MGAMKPLWQRWGTTCANIGSVEDECLAGSKLATVFVAISALSISAKAIFLLKWLQALTRSAINSC